MVKRTLLSTSMLSILFLTVFSMSLSPFVSAESTILYVDPPTIIGLNVGDTFKINITIANVVDLSGWQFSLTYRSDALNSTSISEGPFLKKDGASTFFYIAEFTDNYNATHGLITVACARMASETGVYGSGVLATIVFKIKAAASTVLHLFATKLVDSAKPFGNPIPHTTVDGEVHAGFHDIAVTNVKTSTSQVYAGQPVQVNVTVRNNGDYPETFNVTVYYDSYQIGRQTVVNLLNTYELTLTFTWNTLGVGPDRTYTIRAEASSVPGETNLANNVFVDGVVTVRSRPALLIKINEVIPCNQSGYPQTIFEIGSIAYFKVTVNNTSFNFETVLVTVNAYDSLNTTLGVVSFKGNLMPGVSTFVLGLPIPSSAARGTGKVYANAFTDWLYLGGTAYCPEQSATFEIVST